MKYIIILLAFILAFFLSLTNKERYAIYSLILVLPFMAAPLRDAEFPIIFGLSSFIIFGISLGRLVKNSVITNSNRDYFQETSLIKKWIFFFLLLSIILPLFSDTYNPFLKPEMLYSYVNFICYIVILILFINIMPRNIKEIEKFILIFNSSVFLQLFSYVAMISDLSILPRFLIARSIESTSYYRFSGLFGDHELILYYFMIVIGLSMWFLHNGKYRIISFFTLTTSIVLGLLTGTRSFLIILIIFLMLNAVLVLLKGKFRSKIHIVISVFLAIILVIYLSTVTIFQTIYTRSIESLSLIRLGYYEESFNRKWIEAIPVIIEKAGFWGHGAYLSTRFYDHIIIPHCLYFDMYSKFGVIGLILLIMLLIKIFKMSYKIAINPNMSKPKEFILFSLVIILAVNQVKISSLRYVHTILIYAFLFMIVYIFYKRQRA